MLKTTEQYHVGYLVDCKPFARSWRWAVTIEYLFALIVISAMPVSSYAQINPEATPCTSASSACSEWIMLGSAGSARSMVYRTYALNIRNENVRRALIMIHGALRNPDHYFRTATAAAFLAGALKDTVVIAPDFTSSEGHCHDKLQPGEVNWSCSKPDSWRSGGDAINYKHLTSFDFVDKLLQILANKEIFPNLTTVVIAGHSAGGQFVTRYEMANHVADHLGIAVFYVVANPSSYAWPDATRPLPVGDGLPANAVDGWKDEKPHTDFRYGLFDASKAPRYDDWPYGLEHRTSGYTAGMTNDQLRKQLAARPTTYLLSQVDTLPLSDFDQSPSAMAQGATRRARGEAFVKYIDQHLGANAKVIIVPECGHNDRCVYTTDSVLPVIFPKP